MDEIRKTLQRVFKIIVEQFQNLMEYSNQRQLVLKNKEKETVFRLPMTLVLVIGVIALFMTPLLFLLVIAVVVALFMKYSFEIVQNVSWVNFKIAPLELSS